METSASRELLADLFEEYSLWYSSLAGEYGTLPRSISGVAEDGRQFIYLLDGLELHHMVRNKFIRFVLEEMQSVAYAYGSLDIRGESDEGELVELLDVVAADMERYITGSWQVIRGQDGRVTDLLHRAPAKAGIRKNIRVHGFLPVQSVFPRSKRPDMALSGRRRSRKSSSKTGTLLTESGIKQDIERTTALLPIGPGGCCMPRTVTVSE